MATIEFTEMETDDNNDDIISEDKIKTEKMDEDDSKEENDEDEDPIVKEIPVFLSQGLSKNLHLFQVSICMYYQKETIFSKYTLDKLIFRRKT